MRRIWIVTLFLVVDLVGGVTILSSQSTSDQDSKDLVQMTQVFTETLQTVRQDYLNPSKAGYKALVYGSLHGMLRSLDPHSEFIEPTAFSEEERENRGEMDGLGIVVSQVNGNLTIISSFKDSPAFRAGLQAGDQIKEVNGVSTDHKDSRDLDRLLRTVVGQKIRLMIYRPSLNRFLNVQMTAEVVKVPSVRAVKMMDASTTHGVKIGYLRITEFITPTAQEVSGAVNQLKARGMQALIIDLRFNPGGLVKSAVDTSGVFLPPKTKVVYTAGRDAAERQDFVPTTDGSANLKIPLVLLVNGSTASAAEIMAGALKDLGRALVVGGKTFGKGVVQSEIPLQDGSYVKFTTAEYFTPSNNVIQGHGIQPNVDAPTSISDERALFLVQREGYLTPEEQKIVSSFRDQALDRAVDALDAVMIYTGKK
jgi:carboxyl-terminal processing protease